MEIDRLAQRVAELESLLAEKSAEEDARRLTQFAVDYAGDMVLWIRPDAKLQYVNETMCRAVGYSRDELLNMKLFDVDPDVTTDNWPRAWERLQRQGAYTFDTTFLTKDGESIPVEVSDYYLDYQNTKLCCSICRDITERRSAEAALHAAKDEADRANKAKSRFLAAASHDLRQPLQSLNLLHYALSEHVADDYGKEIVSDLGLTVTVMGDMLSRLLDISKLEAGAVLPSIEEFEINDLLQRILRLFAAQAREKSLDLRVVARSTVVRSDPVLLGQMLENLTANAIHHSMGDKIVVGCRRIGETLRVEIWDNGIGIPDNKIQAIFEEYYQIDNPARDRARGLGLGLSIVERTGRLLGHHVDVASSVGGHTRFSVDVPIADNPIWRDQTPVGSENPDLDFTGLSAVLIEDDDIVLSASQRMLENWGFEVFAGPDASSVSSALKAHSCRPSVIIGDYRLEDGKTGASEIRRIQWAVGERVPSIILTGDTSPQMRRRLSESGSPVLYKPVDPRRLKEIIGELIERAT